MSLSSVRINAMCLTGQSTRKTANVGSRNHMERHLNSDVNRVFYSVRSRDGGFISMSNSAPVQD
eukprot:scaffold1810_cov60-Cyclotella_meneghiniana.AAC.9